MKVIVGLPCLEEVSIKFFQSFFDATLTDEYVKVMLKIVSGKNVVNARNEIVQEALSSNVDYLFFMDSDMQFPQGALQRLLDHQKDIVGGLYCKKYEPFHCVVGRLQSGKIFSVTEFPDGLDEVSTLGTGCILIDTDVFKKMKYPWFEYQVARDMGLDYDDDHFMTEDTVFCIKAGRMDYKIYCDFSIKCGHIGRSTVTPEGKDLVRVRS